MANIKITDLNAYSDPDSTDVLPIVDVGADETKKVSIADLMENAGAGTEALPGIAFDGDPNTGIYRPGADQIAISTAGTQRLLISDSGAVTIPGNLTVQGTTTFIDSQTLQVEDKNIEMGVVTTPTDSTADGGGITLKGATDKTINWVNATDAWTSSERFSVPLGAQGTPSLTFTGDANTGIYSPGADQVAISTNGTGRLFVDADGDVGVGTASPTDTGGYGRALDIQSNTGAAIYLRTDNDTSQIAQGSSDLTIRTRQAHPIIFNTDNAERLRIDSSGRLLVGTSSSRGVGGAARLFQVEGTSSTSTSITTVRNSNDTGGPTIILGKTRGTTNGSGTIVAQNDQFGSIQFAGADGNDLDQTGASITAYVDGTPGSNDMPGRLIFSTNGGSASPTERMRISSNGNVTIDTNTFFVDAVNNRVGVGTTSPDFKLDVAGEIGITEGQRLSWHDGSGGRSASIFGSAGDALAFTTTGSNAEAMRIDSSGRVGVGTSSPAGRLEIKDNGYRQGIVLERGGSTTDRGFIYIGDGTNSTVADEIYLDAYNTAFHFRQGGTGTTETVTFKSNGNVGVGTTSPVRDLQLGDNTSTSEILSLQTTTSGDCSIYFGDNTATSAEYAGMLRYSHGSDAMQFRTSSLERLRIDSSGRVGIGTSSPGTNLHIGSGPGTGLGVLLSRGATTNFFEAHDGTKTFIAGTDNTNAYVKVGTLFNHPVAIVQSNGTAIYIDTSKRVGIGTTSPNAILEASSSVNTTGAIRITNSNSGTGANASFIAHNGTVDAAFGIGGTNYTTYAGIRPNAAFIYCNQAAGIGLTADNASGFINFVTGGSTERARIDSSGRLLVGTSTARAIGGESNPRLQIEGSGASSNSWINVTRFANSGGGPFIQFGKSRSNTPGTYTVVQNNDTLGGITFAGADGTDLANYAAKITAEVDGTPGSNDMPGRLVFSTTANGASSPTERMRISSDGRIRMGGFTGELGNNQAFSLGVQNNTKAAGFYTTASSGWSAITVGRGSNGAVIETFYGTSQVGSVSITSTTTAFNTTSDYRLKENVTPVPDGITRLQQLKPSRFNFIGEPDNTVDGFLAHEVQSVVPEAITGEKDAVDDEGNPEYQGIDQSKLVPLLTAALQEAIAKIETLEAKVAALEAN